MEKKVRVAFLRLAEEKLFEDIRGNINSCDFLVDNRYNE